MISQTVIYRRYFDRRPLREDRETTDMGFQKFLTENGWDGTDKNRSILKNFSQVRVDEQTYLIEWRGKFECNSTSFEI